ncbi:MAG TPA: hypothetical protein VF183_14820 [Acidimicrobiales bacterium]
MLVVLLVLAGLLVFAIAAATIGTTVARLATQPSPTVWKLDEAVEWIADRLPFEVAAEISHDDVRRILQWHLDYFQGVGLASEFGEELGGDAVARDVDAVVAEDEELVDYVVARALEDGRGVRPLDVVCVLDLQLKYLDEIGAIGPRAERRPGTDTGAGSAGPGGDGADRPSARRADGPSSG